MTTMFPYRERILAHVPRWAVVPHIRRQSVAEHSFYVALYTDKLCKMLEWDDLHTSIAVSYALRHDMFEIFSGDIPSPAKRILTSDDTVNAFNSHFVKSMPADYKDGIPTREIHEVVKLADKLDEFFWLCTETGLGNRSVAALLMTVLADIEGRVQGLGLPVSLVEELRVEHNSALNGGFIDDAAS